MAPPGQIVRDFTIVGSPLIPGAGAAIKRLRPGMMLNIVRDKSRQDDPNAVAVCVGNSKIGYLPRGLAAVVGPLMDQGVKVIGRKANNTLEGVCQLAYIPMSEEAPPMINMTPTRPARREAVYDVLDGERDYQDNKFPGLTLEQAAVLIDAYAVKLVGLFHSPPSPNDGAALEFLREIGAVAVRAMELHGTVPRENHVPASAGVTGTMHLFGKTDSTEHKVLPPDHPANTGRKGST